MEYKFFETERLFLKPIASEDAELIFQLVNTPKFIKYVGDRNIHSAADGARYISARMRPQLDRLGFSTYAVVRKSDKMKLGTCGLYDREGLEGIDLGFGLLPDFEGQGFAFESATRLVLAAFQDFDLDSLKAITAKENLASQGLLKKLGFHFASTIALPRSEEEILLFELKAPTVQ